MGRVPQQHEARSHVALRVALLQRKGRPGRRGQYRAQAILKGLAKRCAEGLVVQSFKRSRPIFIGTPYYGAPVAPLGIIIKGQEGERSGG